MIVLRKRIEGQNRLRVFYLFKNCSHFVHLYIKCTLKKKKTSVQDSAHSKHHHNIYHNDM